jgi:7,8-dihydro-6-hydroxymethylpterin-pyrophosphokinase
VIKIETVLAPAALLTALKKIEKKLKQGKKKLRFGPRIIDLDIIYYGDSIIDTDKLVIPHPRMHKRCFVLKPLCDIESKIIHPILKLKPDELLITLLENINNKDNQEVVLLN